MKLRAHIRPPMTVLEQETTHFSRVRYVRIYGLRIGYGRVKTLEPWRFGWMARFWQDDDGRKGWECACPAFGVTINFTQATLNLSSGLSFGVAYRKKKVQP